MPAVAQLGSLPPQNPVIVNPFITGLIDMLSRGGGDALGAVAKSFLPMSKYEQAQTGLRQQEVTQSGDFQRGSLGVENRRADIEQERSQLEDKYRQGLLSLDQYKAQNESLNQRVSALVNSSYIQNRNPGETDEQFNTRQTGKANFVDPGATGAGKSLFPQYVNPNPPPNTMNDLLNTVRGGASSASDTSPAWAKSAASMLPESGETQDQLGATGGQSLVSPSDVGSGASSVYDFIKRMGNQSIPDSNPSGMGGAIPAQPGAGIKQGPPSTATNQPQGGGIGRDVTGQDPLYNMLQTLFGSGSLNQHNGTNAPLPYPSP